jgi:N-carbamoylputrescine amidase
MAQAEIKAGEGDVEANREQLDGALSQLFEEGAELVALPELAALGYFSVSRANIGALSEPVPGGPSVRRWARIAQRYRGYVVGGLLERAGERFYNAAVLVGPDGQVAGLYRKTHLYHWEQDLLTPGNGWVVAPLQNGVRVGLLICYDLRFPEAVRELALRRADIIVAPSTWTSVGKPVLWDGNGYCLHNYGVVAHAYANRVAMVAVDRVGQEAGVTYLGNSMAVDPDGTIVAGPLSGTTPQQVVAELDLAKARSKAVGPRNDLFRDRRPDLYTATQRMMEGRSHD